METKKEIDESIKEHLQTQCAFNFKGYRVIYYMDGRLKVFKRIDNFPRGDELHPSSVAELLFDMAHVK